MFNFSDMQKQMQCQKDSIAELQQKITGMEEQMNKTLELFETTKQELEERTTELEETRGCLETTTSNLKETEHELRKTEIQRDENDFVAHASRENEEDLHIKAKALLSTVQESTQDVSLLHEKLERKATVESHNSSVMQSLDAEVQQRAADTEQMMVELHQEKALFFDQMQQRIRKCSLLPVSMSSLLLLTLSLLSSKSVFSQPFKKRLYEWCSENL